MLQLLVTAKFWAHFEKILSFLSSQQSPRPSLPYTYFYSRQHTHPPSYARPLHSCQCHPIHSPPKSNRVIASTALYKTWTARSGSAGLHHLRVTRPTQAQPPTNTMHPSLLQPLQPCCRPIQPPMVSMQERHQVRLRMDTVAKRVRTCNKKSEKWRLARRPMGRVSQWRFFLLFWTRLM